MENYTVTIGYIAVISTEVKANSHEEAQNKAAEVFEKERDKLFRSKNLSINNHSTKIAGSVNNDESWNLIDF